MNKTIYTFWLGDEKRRKELIEYHKHINKIIYPWKIELGPSKEDHDFLMKNNKYYKKAFDQSIFALCSDVWRTYKILKNGGLYIDSGCTFNENKIKFFLEDLENKKYLFILERPYFFWNGLFYVSEKNSIIMKKIYQKFNKKIYQNFNHTIIMPIFMSNIIFKKIGYRIENRDNIFIILNSYELSKENNENIFHINPNGSWWNKINPKIKRNYNTTSGWKKAFLSFDRNETINCVIIKRLIYTNLFVAWLYTFKLFNIIGNKLFNI